MNDACVFVLSFLVPSSGVICIRPIVKQQQNKKCNAFGVHNLNFIDFKLNAAIVNFKKMTRIHVTNFIFSVVWLTIANILIF